MRALDLLELELRMVMSSYVGAGTQTLVLLNGSVFLITELSTAPAVGTQ